MRITKLWMAGVSLGLLASVTAPANAAPGCWGPPKATYKGPSAPPKASGPVGSGGRGGAAGGAASGPSTPGKRGATGASTPVSRERGQSAKSILKIPWDYPTYQAPEAPQTDGTTARALRKSLTSELAFRTLAGSDPRPLLVLRECEVCNGTDDALFSKGADNERTMLLAQWFHCVKLPMDVLQKDHPFYELFGHDDPEHFFVSLPDGSEKVTLENQTSRTEMWDALNQLLTASYKEDPQASLKQVQKSLEKLDLIDTRLIELRAKKNELLETEGQGSKKLLQVELDIAEAAQDLAIVQAQIAKATKLTPKSAAEAGQPAGKAKSGG